MRFWMNRKFKSLFSAPDRHVVEQVLLLLENKMPYHTIRQSLHLRQDTLDEFVANLFSKAKHTYAHLSQTFSQQQLLQLHVQLYQFRRLVGQTILKKSAYPLMMSMFSYASFLFFFFVLYPLFLTLSDTYTIPYLQVYTLISFVVILCLIVASVLLIITTRSPYKLTLTLRNIHKRFPTSIIFDYYANVFTMVYHLCVAFGFSSLMTIELLRGLHDYPYLQAVAYDIHQECDQGRTLQQAIINQHLSLVLNQTIELGIAANDLPGYLKRLSVSYPTIFLSKLKRILAYFHTILYSFMMVNIAMIVLILQLPTKIMSQLL